MKKTVWLYSLLPLAVVSVLVLAKSDTSISDLNHQKTDSGKWSFSAHPYMGPGYESRPVLVTSVKSEISTLTVVAVRVLNNSSKPVSAIKLGWSLTRETERTRVLQEGQSSLIPIPKGLAIKQDKVLQAPIVSFLDLKPSLLQNEKLEGDYRIDVMVKEILFEDGSQWPAKKGPPSKTATTSRSLK